MILHIKRGALVAFAVWFSIAVPGGALAAESQTDTTTQETQQTTSDDTTSSSSDGSSDGTSGDSAESGGTTDENTSTNDSTTGTSEDETGAQTCTGAGCGQGEDQGTNQGTGESSGEGDVQGASQGEDQGGPTLEELGAVKNEDGEWVLPEGVKDTRQGAHQGASHGTENQLSGENTNTGAGSDNTINADVASSQTNTTRNSADDTTDATLSGNTGRNTNSENTGSGNTSTGDAGIGVTQVKNDNTTTQGGQATVNVRGHKGDQNKDLEVQFENMIAQLAGDGSDNQSIRAVNDTTGEGSENEVILSTFVERLEEIENDGKIDNTLNAEAVTGENESSRNTENGVITTGNANVAATLVNLLNTTVINGNLAVSVEDVFGNLNGDIRIPDLAQLAAILGGNTGTQGASAGGDTTVDAGNEQTGTESENEVEVNVSEEEKTSVDNEADVDTTVNANAVTGQNEAEENTGGGSVKTGDATASASNVTVANTTVENGNWGLVIVNALNRWVGFLVGDSGQTKRLSKEQTIREIEARNEDTGSDSENRVEVNDERRSETSVDNDAEINNTVNADAITGRNRANRNTGSGVVQTGDANIQASAVNLANTTVKDANLGIAIVNVLGNWTGDLLYAGKSLLASAQTGGGQNVSVDAQNAQTGADSDNSVDVNVERTKETDVDNEADVTTTLNANVDTGNNAVNRNTAGAQIETGDSELALHARTMANLTGIGRDGAIRVNIEGNNEQTGVESRNRINAEVNDERIIDVNNDANVSTVVSATVNTGRNQLNRNTIAGNIITGDADARLAIHNMVNRVMLALGSETNLSSAERGAVRAELENGITGAESENRNIVDYITDVITSVANNADIQNIIDIILNTGENEQNENTGTYTQAGFRAGSLNTSSSRIARDSDADEASAHEQAQTPTASDETDSSGSVAIMGTGGGHVQTGDDPEAGDRDGRTVATTQTVDSNAGETGRDRREISAGFSRLASAAASVGGQVNATVRSGSGSDSSDQSNVLDKPEPLDLAALSGADEQNHSAGGDWPVEHGPWAIALVTGSIVGAGGAYGYRRSHRV